MDKDTHGERDHDAAARDFSISPAQLLTRHAVLIPIQRTDPTRREVKLRLLAARHFATVPLAGATESTESGSAGPSAETATGREVWFATESAAIKATAVSATVRPAPAERSI